MRGEHDREPPRPSAYRRVAATLLRFRLVQRVRGLLATPMHAKDVAEVIDALELAELEAWVAGGWGVDMLVGAQTRKHLDLDLVVSDVELTRAHQVLDTIGFRERDRQVLETAELSLSIAFRDDAGRRVDLHPVDVDAFPASSADLDSEAPWVHGSLEGRPVRCLSAVVQLVLHQRYELRYYEHRDVALLHAHVSRSARREEP
jgi:lincosamide nucleotidyltransferase A/C/D/E